MNYREGNVWPAGTLLASMDAGTSARHETSMKLILDRQDHLSVSNATVSANGEDEPRSRLQ